jgi:hypothetical protein
MPGSFFMGSDHDIAGGPETLDLYFGPLLTEAFQLIKNGLDFGTG